MPQTSVCEACGGVFREREDVWGSGGPRGSIAAGLTAGLFGSTGVGASSGTMGSVGMGIGTASRRTSIARDMHGDLVRSVVLGKEFVVSGSYDQSIKVG